MADRPEECSHCKKPASVTYKEIAAGFITCTDMCEDCPILQSKLTGKASIEKKKPSEKDTGLCCASCGTSFEAIQTGNPLGCSECYLVFEELILQDLHNMKLLPSRITGISYKKKSQPLHIGKSPSPSVEVPASPKLTALNEALNEALKKENYEQAAWLRDQIKDLIGKPDEPAPPTP
jgi:protein arginine kinase activator